MGRRRHLRVGPEASPSKGRRLHRSDHHRYHTVVDGQPSPASTTTRATSAGAGVAVGGCGRVADVGAPGDVGFALAVSSTAVGQDEDPDDLPPRDCEPVTDPERPDSRPVRQAFRRTPGSAEH